jgi:hypothetical protein
MSGCGRCFQAEIWIEHHPAAHRTRKAATHLHCHCHGLAEWESGHNLSRLHGRPHTKIAVLRNSELRKIYSGGAHSSAHRRRPFFRRLSPVHLGPSEAKSAVPLLTLMVGYFLRKTEPNCPQTRPRPGCKTTAITGAAICHNLDVHLRHAGRLRVANCA